MTAQSDDHPVEAAPQDEELVTEDLLVEEVSIDGMCGVY
ncbi:mycofactocin precursor MftA [Streptomyces sp. NPDC005374]